MSYTSGESTRFAPGHALADPRDFALGVPGFSYADLHDPRRLADLAREFDRALQSADPALFTAFEAHRQNTAASSSAVVSDLLLRVAGHLSRFVGRLFGIE